ncbi:hypothetical protein MLD38_002495 [Melastoma candidum]|uniref:Uncharacterized protein n=1 Tax=Melastoma candidum TaxID=119954 RepID=A0ACB9RZQ9_9MYRT|nr:hypothetical protein MLD38_002495 [Melastoma candidum]
MVTINMPEVELTPAGRPILLPTETECSLLSGVQLLCEDDDRLSHFSLHLDPGLLTLTTHRLILIPENSSTAAPSSTQSQHSSSTSRPCSIPLGSITQIFVLKKSIKAMFGSPRLRFQLSVDSEGRVGKTGRSVVVTAVMRGKGDVEAFVDKFRRTWEARVWERDPDGSAGGQGSGGSNSTGNHSVGDSVSGSGRGGFDSRGMRVVGVSGILRREQEIWENTDKNLQEAFQDLNALMSKAKEMVMLAEKMRLKLLSGQSQVSDEELGTKEEMQDWLLSVGVISPVTKESAGALYHQQLSRQLADFVRIPLDRAGGMINLIDMYCLFNRARGTELISPEDLLQACSLWEKFDVPVMLRKFDSGVMVIQNKAQRDEEVFSRIKSLVTRADTLRTGISASDAAITLGIAPALAKEHLLAAESQGLLCRDISPDGFRFYVNLFPEICIDDIHLVMDEGLYTAWIKSSSLSRLMGH